ncbi:MAG: T9SS type A sorting domain-containing protein [Ignavibacteriales bacterium]|nr:T9SS type A sorting domain-containing protein [Ignavibacteriales bacterium]
MLRWFNVFYVLFMGFLLFPAPAYSQHYYVAVSGNDVSGSGSQTNPWKTITKALSVVNGSQGNMQYIYVLPGTYSSSATGEVFPVNLKSFVSLFSTTAKSAVLDAESSSRMFTVSNVTNSAIEGFTMKNGNAPTISPNASFGGGILLEQSSFIVIRNNDLFNNRAFNNMGGSSAGGAIRAYDCHHIQVTGNTFRQNTATADGSSGGALSLICNNSIISHNIIDNNATAGNMMSTGGGLAVSGLNLVFNNVFTNNSSVYIGGAIAASGGYFFRNTITGNAANGMPYESSGGGFNLGQAAASKYAIGNSKGNGNNIYNNTAPFGKNLYIWDTAGVYAMYNYWGPQFPVDTNNIAGKIFAVPYETSPIVFDTTVIVASPSPVNFDTTIQYQSRMVQLTLVNVRNTLTDTIPVLSISCGTENFSVARNQLNIPPAGIATCNVTFTPKTIGALHDTLKVQTPWKTYHYELSGVGRDIGVGNLISCYEPEFDLFLEQNYPNPFNPATRIQFSIANTGNVRLFLYTITGELVAILRDEVLQPGLYSQYVYVEKLSSGVYVYRLQAGGYVFNKKMIVVK